MRLTRSRPFAFLLLLCLLFAQATVGAHALTHLPVAHAMADLLDAPDGDGRGAAHVCLECLAGQALDFAAPPAIHSLAVPVAHSVLAPARIAAAARKHALRANSRAPPVLL